ncbi:aromatic ring-hydroxylating oxygenase subunit alpha [Novosphingobium album (ex Liu et al. 2023)]|uniref:Aromatic ring-hydroxylating dioxygenase subunit alpha n=1 Tax=Novosphingobium album (ex Liu et al. 2023) TaxID=3031130 RepID=A0ABT5WNF6_9SPHN|nr:aromatic ring-hydroxylating dioxygenase subunit alpha [Novosphingobium album (ex Liu et al. 2023)]MDE8651571.1 aromatic ring-hydroxylating dioxygenase subunit alpha [Novosphingobium album (ex Liu et al. 2023)]
MNEASRIEAGAQDMPRPMVIPVEAYISADYARAECDRLWRKCWLQAGRVEDLPEIGSYLTYDIVDDSVLIVRVRPGEEPGAIKAYRNVCTHRGRRLVDTPKGMRNARGRQMNFVCGFHAWTFELDGSASYIAAKEDWGPALCDAVTRLGEVKLDTWGGFLWINLDPEAEPLRAYLEPAATMLDPFRLQDMRPRWRKWTVFDCNWKVALEAFNETYHVPGTHPEFMAFGDFTGWGRQQGKHSHIGYDAPKGLEENKAKLRLGAGDPRISTAEMQKYTWEGVNTNTTQTLVDVAQSLPAVLAEDTPADEVLRYWLDTARALDERRGVVWPKVDSGHVAASGTAWQIFPNQQIGHAVNNMLCYHARPFGHDPDKCYFEVAVYELYPEGAAPETEWEYANPEQFPHVLRQDFSNMAAVQQGMKTGGYAGNIPNPKGEGAVISLHRNLARYMGTGEPRELG